MEGTELQLWLPIKFNSPNKQLKQNITSSKRKTKNTNVPNAILPFKLLNTKYGC